LQKKKTELEAKSAAKPAVEKSTTLPAKPADKKAEADKSKLIADKKKEVAKKRGRPCLT